MRTFLTWEPFALVFLFVAVMIAFGLLRERDHLNGNLRFVARVEYRCKEGKSIDAKYFQGESVPSAGPDQPPQPGGSVSLILYAGASPMQQERIVPLQQTISADGARYANDDESFIFWSKGDGAFIIENGVITYVDCTQVGEVR